ncbi:MAG: response regulator [Spirochaetales bacterium]|nr:response regulator [Spirochaetales bacterium]
MDKNNKKIRIFSALEVANICGVVNQTAINWIKNGHLKAFTTPGGQYRIYAEDLISFLENRQMRVPDELRLLRGSMKTLLIVDDDVELNNMLKNYLDRKLEKCEVLQAFDGFEAGQMIADRKPNVIILDIDLPGINGHKLCQKIRSDKVYNNPVIISISGLTSENIRQQILSDGADAFFVKPFDFSDITAEINKVL